jgi:hypothetical protein
MCGRLSQRWDRVKTELTLNDLVLDASGKILIALGFGALLAERLASYIWCLVGTGLILVLWVKMRHWKKFWGA